MGDKNFELGKYGIQFEGVRSALLRMNTAAEDPAVTTEDLKIFNRILEACDVALQTFTFR